MTFSVIGFGLFLVTVPHSWNHFNQTRFLLRALEPADSKGEPRLIQLRDDDQKLRILGIVFQDLQYIIAHFSVFLCILAFAACFEVLWGFSTLSGSAKFITACTLPHSLWERTGLWWLWSFSLTDSMNWNWKESNDTAPSSLLMDWSSICLVDHWLLSWFHCCFINCWSDQIGC